MKAAYLVKHGNPFEAFEFRESDLSDPKEYEVQVEVHASGLNFADVLARMGLYPEAPKPPGVLGYEITGLVKKTGTLAKHFKIGDRVLGFTRFGGYADTINISESNLVKIPGDIDFAVATALGTQYTTAYFAAARMVNLVEGDHVLVQAAAGGVGTALVQYAKHRGCIVYGTAGSPEKLDYLKKMGVDHPINYRKENCFAAIRKISPKRRLDVVFDSLGGKSAREALGAIGAGGRVVNYGVASLAGARTSKLRAIKAMIDFGILHPITLLSKSKSWIGINLLKIADNRPDILIDCMKEVSTLADQGVFKPVLGKAFDAMEIGKAHEHLGARQSVGKVAITWH